MAQEALPNRQKGLARFVLAGTLLATLVALPLRLYGQEVDSRDEPIRVDVNLVTLRFSVRSADGKFLNDLDRANFTIQENGRPVDIAFFDRPRRDTANNPPLWLAFLLDVSGSTFATRVEEILAAEAFFENIYDVTQVGIFGFTDKLMVFQNFTVDRQSAVRAFGAARQHLGRTAIYSSLDSLMTMMDQRAAPTDRKAVIVISDGIDDAFKKAAASIALARASNIVIYTVWVPSAAQLYIGPASKGEISNPAGREEKEKAFARLGPGTGGKHFGGFESILDFDNVLAEINDELFGNLYTVGYNTDNPYLDRADRGIRIEVARTGASVHGIFEKMPDRVGAKKQYIAALFDASPLAGLPGRGEAFRELGTDLDILRPRVEGGETSIPFRLKVSPFSLRPDENGAIRTQFGIIAQLFDLQGNEEGRLREFFRAQLTAAEIRDGRGVIYNNRVVAPPGEYVLRIALIEIPGWRMTVMDRPVTIAEKR